MRRSPPPPRSTRSHSFGSIETWCYLLAFGKWGPRDSWLTPCIDSATLRRTLGIASRLPTRESDRLTINRHSFDLMCVNATHHPLCSLTCQASPSVQSE